MENTESDAKFSVPCNGCNECCKYGDMPRLQPELYPEDTGFDEIERDGKRYLRLKDNGDCVYLSETGCSIHAARPMACRPFDCIELLEVVEKLPPAYYVIPVRVLDAAKFRSQRA